MTMFIEKVRSYCVHAKILISRQYSPVARTGEYCLGRLEPISRKFGIDRGRPIDRYYIEKFLSKNCNDIRGRVLEVGSPHYTNIFGASGVISDVLHAEDGNSLATLVGDLATGVGIPEQLFDCMILTQTFPFIYNVHDAIKHAYAALKPGGVLLATLSGISQISRYDMEKWGDYWRFTTASATRLFADVFGPNNVNVESHGNVLVACAFLQGVAVEELDQSDLDFNDLDYQVSITVRAVRAWGK